MVDFIFGVSHTQHWHDLNLSQHPHHYSGMRYMGSGAISWLQDKSGAGVYFNPYVEMDGLVNTTLDINNLDHQIWRCKYGYSMSRFTPVGYPIPCGKAAETCISLSYETDVG
jgi:Phosphatidate cytidylyltransferase, mitochondrial